MPEDVWTGNELLVLLALIYSVLSTSEVIICGEHHRTTALWRKPLTNLELGILPKLWPWLLFSPARIISDRNIWMFSAFQFHFQFLFKYELKAIFCSSGICQKSVAIQQAAERMQIKLGGLVERSPWSPNPNTFADPGYANIYEIFVYFQMLNPRWTAVWRKLLLSSFFPNRILSFYMPSFKFLWLAVQVFHRQIQIIHSIFDSFDKENVLHKMWVILHHPERFWT